MPAGYDTCMLALCGASSISSWREAPQSSAVPTTAERIDAANTAILAAEKSAALGNACPAMKSDIVKPMPARAPAPANCRHVYSAGLTAMPARTAAAAAKKMPSGFPMTHGVAVAEREVGVHAKIGGYRDEGVLFELHRPRHQRSAER